MTRTLETMIRAVLAGGREVMRVYAGEFDVELKDDKSPLTEADRRSHDAIVGILGREAPDIPLLSEEGSHTAHGERAAWDRYFLIDPLDGTKEFIKRNGEFTVNVALVERSRGGVDETTEAGAPAGALSTAEPNASPQDGGATPVSDVWYPSAGVVYVPDLGELFVGGPGGAWWWGDVSAEKVGAGGAGALGVDYAGTGPAEGGGGSVRLPHRTATRPYTIIASRSHMSPETEAFVSARRSEHPDLELLSAGSSLKLCRVADGSADEYPRFAPTMEWDTAAGDAVARAAGCRVVAWDGSAGAPIGPLRYNKEDLHNPWFLVARRTTT